RSCMATVDDAWAQVARAVARATCHLAVPRAPPGHPSLLQQVVHLAVALPAHLVLLPPGDLLRARDRGHREPRAVVGVGPRLGLGARDGDETPRPAAPLRRRGLLRALPALGDLAADPELQPLPLRGDPVPVSDPGAA